VAGQGAPESYIAIHKSSAISQINCCFLFYNPNVSAIDEGRLRFELGNAVMALWRFHASGST
jgi:hypothetical protein